VSYLLAHTGGDGQVAGTSFRQRVDQVVYRKPVGRGREGRGGDWRSGPSENNFVQQFHKCDHEVRGDAG